MQKCWLPDDPDTRRRVLKGLLNAYRFCEVKNGWIITADKEEEFAEDNVNVKVIVGWKWMLEPGNWILFSHCIPILIFTTQYLPLP